MYTTEETYGELSGVINVWMINIYFEMFRNNIHPLGIKLQDADKFRGYGAQECLVLDCTL